MSCLPLSQQHSLLLKGHSVFVKLCLKHVHHPLQFKHLQQLSFTSWSRADGSTTHRPVLLHQQTQGWDFCRLAEVTNSRNNRFQSHTLTLMGFLTLESRSSILPTSNRQLSIKITFKKFNEFHQQLFFFTYKEGERERGKAKEELPL